MAGSIRGVRKEPNAKLKDEDEANLLLYGEEKSIKERSARVYKRWGWLNSGAVGDRRGGGGGALARIQRMRGAGSGAAAGMQRGRYARGGRRWMQGARRRVQRRISMSVGAPSVASDGRVDSGGH